MVKPHPKSKQNKNKLFNLLIFTLNYHNKNTNVQLEFINPYSEVGSNKANLLEYCSSIVIVIVQ